VRTAAIPHVVVAFSVQQEAGKAPACSKMGRIQWQLRECCKSIKVGVTTSSPRINHDVFPQFLFSNLLFKPKKLLTGIHVHTPQVT
jgi:hypothetical protein